MLSFVDKIMCMCGKKLYCISISLLLAGGIVFSETEGEKLFKTNRSEEAVIALEKEIEEGNVTKDTFNFLGLAYFQNGEYEKSIDAFERGLKSPVSSKKLICFNEGNVAFSKGDYKKAESCFNFALSVAPDFYPALLNRANTFLQLSDYKKALSDYKSYIQNVPDDKQSESIQRLISYLEEQIVYQEAEEKRQEEENRRLAEENERLQAEIARKEAERKAKEEEERAREAERRRKLLEDVANSLQQTDSMNMTAGAEDVLDYEYESELD